MKKSIHGQTILVANIYIYIADMSMFPPCVSFNAKSIAAPC
jgi:hypothetical protein